VQPQPALWHSQVAIIPHWSAGPPIVHVFVQKCAMGSPSVAQMCADTVLEQSLSVLQNAPTPMSLPTSPGCPQNEAGASGAASGVAGLLLLEHAATNAAHTTMTAILFLMESGA